MCADVIELMILALPRAGDKCAMCISSINGNGKISGFYRHHHHRSSREFFYSRSFRVWCEYPRWGLSSLSSLPTPPKSDRKLKRGRLNFPFCSVSIVSPSHWDALFHNLFLCFPYARKCVFCCCCKIQCIACENRVAITHGSSLFILTTNTKLLNEKFSIRLPTKKIWKLILERAIYCNCELYFLTKSKFRLLLRYVATVIRVFSFFILILIPFCRSFVHIIILRSPLCDTTENSIIVAYLEIFESLCRDHWRMSSYIFRKYTILGYSSRLKNSKSAGLFKKKKKIYIKISCIFRSILSQLRGKDNRTCNEYSTYNVCLGSQRSLFL